MEKLALNGYLARSEYQEQLDIIQKQIYLTLLQNDVRFGGTDDIEAVLVFGSYADTFFKTGTTSIRKSHPQHTGSDLDVLTFERNIGRQAKLGLLNPIDMSLAKEIHPFPVEDFVRIPQLRFTYLLRQNLRRAGLNLAVDHPSLEINLDAPTKMESEFLGDQGNPQFRIRSGLLFVPDVPNSQSVFEIAKKSKLPIVWNPATDTEVLVYYS
jgi:hypothetical protein